MSRTPPPPAIIRRESPITQVSGSSRVPWNNCVNGHVKTWEGKRCSYKMKIKVHEGRADLLHTYGRYSIIFKGKKIRSRKKEGKFQWLRVSSMSEKERPKKAEKIVTLESTKMCLY